MCGLFLAASAKNAVGMIRQRANRLDALCKFFHDRPQGTFVMPGVGPETTVGDVCSAICRKYALPPIVSGQLGVQS